MTVRDGDTALKLPLKYRVIGSNNSFTEQHNATAEMSSEYLQSENLLAP